MKCKYEQEFEREIDKAYIIQCLYDMARANMEKPDKYPTYIEYKELNKAKTAPDDGVDLNEVFDAEMAKLIEEEKRAEMTGDEVIP